MIAYDEDGTQLTIYSPDERQGGLIWVVRQGFRDICGGRHVVARLFMRDFVAQFRQKILGYFWALLTPLLGILNFLYLNFTGVLKPGVTDMPYALYVLIGSNIWSVMNGTMGAVSGGLQSQADLIMRTSVPKLALAVSSLASALYGILISMVTMGVVFLIHGIWPSPWFVAYPLLIAPLIIMGVSMGLIISVAGVIAKDLPAIATQALGILMYITPVVYLPEKVENSVIRAFVQYNPFTYLVDIPRSLIFHGTAHNIELYLLIAMATLLCLIISLRIFYLISDLVAERL